MANRAYCTYFDHNYLPRGLALYHSLQRHAPGAQLWVLCLSEACHQALTALDLPNLMPVRLADFEAANPDVEATRPTRRSAITKYRKSNRSQFWSIAMGAPDDDSSQSTVLSFKRRQIANAAFVQAAAIIDYQNVAWLRAFHCFQKNVDASIMSDRQRRASETLIRCYRPNARRTDSKGNLQP